MPITGRSKDEIVRQVMHEGKHGRLHSGKGGPKVKSRKQMIAIALSKARERGYK